MQTRPSSLTMVFSFPCCRHYPLRKPREIGLPSCFDNSSWFKIYDNNTSSVFHVTKEFSFVEELEMQFWGGGVLVYAPCAWPPQSLALPPPQLHGGRGLWSFLKWVVCLLVFPFGMCVCVCVFACAVCGMCVSVCVNSFGFH